MYELGNVSMHVYRHIHTKYMHSEADACTGSLLRLRVACRGLVKGSSNPSTEHGFHILKLQNIGALTHYVLILFLRPP